MPVGPLRQFWYLPGFPDQVIQVVSLKVILRAVVIVLVVVLGSRQFSDSAPPINGIVPATDGAPMSEVERAFLDKASDRQLSGVGTVERILSDDNEGDRHQRFVLNMGNGHTVLVAHNIDVASRIDDIAMGDRVEFFGEYEWNLQGGVIHWTHHDPDGWHADGWLRHNDRKYD